MVNDTTAVQQAAALMTSMNVKELRSLKRLVDNALIGACQLLDDLPIELRLRIYELLLVNPDPDNERWIWKTEKGVRAQRQAVYINPAWRQPALLLACKQIRTEALPVYLEKNRFVVDCHWYDSTALLRFYTNAKTQTEKYGDLRVEVEMGGDGISEKDWQNIWRWLRAYYDGDLPYRPRFDEDPVAEDLAQPEYHTFVSAMFNMLEDLQKAGCAWSVVQQVLKEAYEAVNVFTSWNL